MLLNHSVIINLSELTFILCGQSFHGLRIAGFVLDPNAVDDGRAGSFVEFTLNLGEFFGDIVGGHLAIRHEEDDIRRRARLHDVAERG